MWKPDAGVNVRSTEQALHTMVHNRFIKMYLWCSALQVSPKWPAKDSTALNKVGSRRVSPALAQKVNDYCPTKIKVSPILISKAGSIESN